MYILFQPTKFIFQFDNLIPYLLAYRYRFFLVYVNKSWRSTCIYKYIYNTIPNEQSSPQSSKVCLLILLSCVRVFRLFNNRVSFYLFEKKNHLGSDFATATSRAFPVERGRTREGPKVAIGQLG